MIANSQIEFGGSLKTSKSTGIAIKTDFADNI